MTYFQANLYSILQSISQGVECSEAYEEIRNDEKEKIIIRIEKNIKSIQ